MLFNSIDFAIFLPIVFFLYWFVFKKNLKLQNLFLVVASYVFYGWWDFRFLGLIIISSLVDYLVGVGLLKKKKITARRLLLLTSMAVNFGFLLFFKYFDFFAESFVNAFTIFGTKFNPITLNIILPVGISFYTFQTLSYSIDVYRGNMKPTKDIISFFAFVSFFPQLVAGPIERAKNLLSQFYKKRIFEYTQAADGLRQILWGLFKKIVIADNCAIYVNDIFVHYTNYSGSTLFLGVLLFAFQIYGDFSGYSDIAIGTARLFGFKLKRNFAYPYFSRDIAEFWRRWHISLSTWFRDYLYIPLGGSRGTALNKIKNIFIIFIVSGFWHGANWTFIAWGFLNACYFLPIMLMKKNREHLDIAAQDRILPTIKEILQIGTTFFLTLIAWIFFRAESITHAFSYLAKMFSVSLFSKPNILPIDVIVLITIFIIIEWIQRKKPHALDFDYMIKNKVIRYFIYYIIIGIIIYFGGNQEQFIYFQF
ncbi:MAG: MBOAT family protein [Spirochaetales bacterium]|nr:MBOAT family protein [Spirochaetales bacterium]